MVQPDRTAIENERIRSATAADALTVRRILDAAMLETNGLDRRIEAGDVVVSIHPAFEFTAESGAELDVESGAELDIESGAELDVESGAELESDSERVLGVAVLEPGSDATIIRAIAVRNRVRGRGIGSALVERALERSESLIARFDGDVKPFYESLGFTIRPIGDDRFEGIHTPDTNCVGRTPEDQVDRTSD